MQTRPKVGLLNFKTIFPNPTFQNRKCAQEAIEHWLPLTRLILSAGPKLAQPQQQPTNGGLQSSSLSAASSATGGASAGAAGGGAPSSWASAASKGLPPSSDPGANANGPQAAGSGASAASASTSKQLEQLNSVREALFSQVRVTVLSPRVSVSDSYVGKEISLCPKYLSPTQ